MLHICVHVCMCACLIVYLRVSVCNRSVFMLCACCVCSCGGVSMCENLRVLCGVLHLQAWTLNDMNGLQGS
jgi:hypothetical protein